MVSIRREQRKLLYGHDAFIDLDEKFNKGRPMHDRRREKKLFRTGGCSLKHLVLHPSPVVMTRSSNFVWVSNGEYKLENNDRANNSKG